MGLDMELSKIHPEDGDVIVVKIDVKGLPFAEMDDFEEVMFKLRSAFPKNKVILMAKTDEIIVEKQRDG